MQETAKALRSRGYDVSLAGSADDAREKALALIPKADLVAIGGCMTAKQLGLHDLLRARGQEVLWHWEAPPEERRPLLQRANAADTYILSANALLADGRIVNLDGHGNRVASAIWGPGHLLYLIGRNKIVRGSLEDAMARVREVACPLNARRLSLPLPCGATGKCVNCSAPQRFCNAWSILERPTSAVPAHVLLIDADLGF